MKLSSLRIYCALCQHMGMKKTEKALNLTHSQLVYAIKELENEFRVTLLSQKGYSFVLTKEGEEFYSLCKELITRADETEKRLHEICERKEKIRIGISPMLAATLYGSIERDIRKKFPELELQRYEIGSVNVKEQLLSGKLDCGICVNTDTDGELFDKLPIGKAEYVCCVGHNHPLAEELNLSVSQLEKEPIVSLDSTFDCYHHVRRIFEKERIKPNIIMETNQLETLRNLVAFGNSISFMLKEYAELYPNQLIRIPLEEQKEKLTVNLIWPRNRSISSKMTKVLSSVIK